MGMFVSFVWELSLVILRLDTSAWALSFRKFRLERATENLSLRTCTWGLLLPSLGNFDWEL